MDKEEALRLMEPLVKYLARRYAGLRAEKEDLEQEARLGVLEALKTFDPAKSAFKTFARKRAFCRIVDYIRRNRRDVLELNNPKMEALVNFSFLRFRGRVTGTDHKEQKLVRRVHKNVTARMIEVLRKLTKEEKSVEQTAIEMGIVPRTVRMFRSELFRLWGVSNIIQAYNRAMREGLIEPPTKEQHSGSFEEF